MPSKLQAACTQLLTRSDLNIPSEVAARLEKRAVAATIHEEPEPSIMIYSSMQIALSDILPIVSDYGLRVLSEVSFVTDLQERKIYVTKLLLESADLRLLKRHRANIIESLTEVLLDPKFASCRLFHLIYREDFCARGVLLFRTIVHYENQLVLEFNINHIIDVLIKYHTVSKLFLDYFDNKFAPGIEKREAKLKETAEALMLAFKEVESADEDRILKLFYEILRAMTRTSYYLDKPSIAIKIDTKTLKPYLIGVQPNIEIFVYAPTFRGLHLRMGLVARGGLRYSTRPDDYRVEVKSLMAAQEGKNAIIIPSGAKGGFVIDTPRAKLTQEEFRAYYTTFVDSLLDMVDNKEKERIVRDEKIVAYDGEDTYFVVAADRGTASMSDVANAIAKRRGFWIGDAFASGGSNGYHHKKLGVTAKGALKSMQRFFIEKGIDFYKEPITVVGIGSMGGDVFGNGLIASDRFKLVGAISHDEVFIDPDPDPLVSWRERVRLFGSKHAKWSDYDTRKISKGGGVFKRDAVDITVSDEIARLLRTRRRHFTGEQLANMLLKLPVDMIYNGGVGTYVKASTESNLSVGDKENEYVRVDAQELEAFCFCEGGNLGMTQAARIEYARKGGRVNLDSIDNAAGVNTSDHEVNLKIILNALVKKGVITEEEKDKQLAAMSDHVVNSVLWTNYFQALAISLERIRSQKKRSDFIKAIEVLEQHLEVFKRRYFAIPRNAEFDDVVDAQGRILRPILAVLILYAKIFLKKLLNQSDLYEKDSFFEKYLFKYFPKQFIAIYEDEILSHPLRKEITSMIIANKIIDYAGATFIADYDELGSERFLYKIKSYLITNQLFDANDTRFELYRADYTVDVTLQYKLLLKIEEEIAYNVNWMLKSLPDEEIDFASILEYKKSIRSVIERMELPIKPLLPGNEKVNTFFAYLNLLKFATAILKITKSTGFGFTESASLFYRIVQEFEIPLLIEKIENIPIHNPSDALLQLQLQELIEYLVVDLTRELLRYKREGEDTRTVLRNYLEEKAFNFERYEKMLEYLKSSDHLNISDLSITVNYLLFIKS